MIFIYLDRYIKERFISSHNRFSIDYDELLSIDEILFLMLILPLTRNFSGILVLLPSFTNLARLVTSEFSALTMSLHMRQYFLVAPTLYILTWHLLHSFSATITLGISIHPNSYNSYECEVKPYLVPSRLPIWAYVVCLH